jgi:phage terminase large subunit
MVIEIEQDVFNPAYIDLLEDRSRYLILYGGAGAGKSYFAAQKVLIRTLQEKRSRILIVRKVARTLRHSSFLLLKDLISQWNLDSLFRINDVEMKITCINGNQILFAGLDDPEKLKSIAGITSIWIEEATELSEEDFIQVDLRLRDPSEYHQVILTFNPISALHWIKKRFFDTVDRRATIRKMTYEDNRFVDATYIEVLEGLKHQNENLYKVYALGEWGTLTELIYTNWDVKEFSLDFEEVIAGVDFGFNNPSAVAFIGLKDGELYVFDEIYQSRLKNADLIDLLKDKPQANIYYPDTAEPDRIEELQEAGFIIGKTSKDIIQGINFIKNFKIHIHPRCVNFIKEIQGYSYKRDKDGNILEEPVKFNDHLMDALRYAVYSHFKKGTPEVVVV